MVKRKINLRVVFRSLALAAFLIFPSAIFASTTDTRTDWSNFSDPVGYTVPYTYNGQPVYDHEGSQDPTNGGSGATPARTDLSSGSPDGSFPGPYDTPFIGYYNGGTVYDPDDPVTLEDDFIRFTMRLDGDPSHSTSFASSHWNVLFDVDNDGYKEFWVDLDGTVGTDVVKILYNNDNTQLVADPAAAQVEEFLALNSEDTPAEQSHTRVRAADDGTGDYFIDIQVPMTAFNDLNGNQILFPDSPVGFIFSTSTSNNDPLQKDFMTDIEYISSEDPVHFGDIIIPNGRPEMHFADSSLEEADFYTVGDDIYMYLRDPLANDDPNAIETVVATIANPATGDDETVTLTETAPGSGIFSNKGGATKPVSSNPTDGWIQYAETSAITTDKCWRATYTGSAWQVEYTDYQDTDSNGEPDTCDAAGWTADGSFTTSQDQGTYTSTPDPATGYSEVTFTLYEDRPNNGDTVTFETYAADRLTSSTSDAVDNNSDDSGDLEVVSGDVIHYSYTNDIFGTLTDTADIVGPGEPYIQFTRANGLPSDNFEIGRDLLYVTVYYTPSADPLDPNYDSSYDPADVNTITVALSGSDSETLTLTETYPGSGIFRNTTGLDTSVAPPEGSTSDNSDWEDGDQGEVTATFTRENGGTFSTTANLFYTDEAGRVYFTNGAGTEDVEQYAPGQPVFLKVTDEPGLGSVNVTVTSDAGDSEIVTLYETATNSGVYMNRTNDLVTADGSATVTSATGFAGVSAGDTFIIATGPDAGTYTVNSVVDANTITLDANLTATRTDIGFNANPLMTATYDGAFTADDDVIEAEDQDTLEVEYNDASDGDNDPANNVKTDTALYNAPPIVINEVLFYENIDDEPVAGGTTSYYEYIQLYNSSSFAETVTGYEVSDGDTFNYAIPQYDGGDITLNPGQELYVVLVPESSGDIAPYYDAGTDAYYVFATGADGTGVGYDQLSDPADSDTSDQVLLYNAADRVVDYVGWGNTNDSLDYKSDDFDAVDANIWTDNDYKDIDSADPGPISQGNIIEREVDGLDNNVPSDWVYGSSTLPGGVIITYAVITSFVAYENNGAGLVEWRTASESNLLGFYLCRKDGKSGKFERLNDKILPALFVAQQGGTYRFADDTAVPGETYAYRLTEVETDGKKRTHGPFTVTVEGAVPNDYDDAADSKFAGRPHDIPEEKKARNEAAKAEREAARADKTNRRGYTVKLFTSRQGLYYLDESEIAALMGIKRNQARSLIRSGHISLENMGKPVDWLPEGNGSGFYFFGEAMDSIYTDSNVYWLGAEKGSKMETVSLKKRQVAGSVDAEATFTRTALAEVDQYPATALSDPETDYWLWDFVFAGHPFWGAKSFGLETPGAAGGPEAAVLTVRLMGGNITAISPDHHVGVKVNGVSVGEGYIDDLEFYDLTASFDASILNDGENTIEITGLADTGAPYSLVFVDSLEIQYPSYYNADADRLAFRGDGNDAVAVSGFSTSDIFVLELSDPKHPKLIETKLFQNPGGDYGVTVEPSSPETLYCAVSKSGAFSADDAWADRPSDLQSVRNRADYLVIAPAQLIDAARALADYRRNRGLETLVVDLEDIMDEFNAGISSPWAIRDFLSHAYFNWDKAPTYVVLAGSGTFDYKDNMGYGGNLIPPAMVGTPYELSASDGILADVDGEDGVPEMAVGRLPMISGEELTAYMDKIIAFEMMPESSRQNVAMLADNAEGAGNFPGDSDDLADLLPETCTAEKIYLPRFSPAGARAKLFETLENGAAFVNYIGHAGIDRLASESLLAVRDIPEMQNAGNPPVMTLMTCLAGRFEYPGFDSLAEALVVENGGGAAAVWSASGMSENAEAKRMIRELFDAVFIKKKETLGLSIVAARKGYAENGGKPFMSNIYNLLGDPALRIND